ncbi:hypothetical protein SY88_22705 [Clostridiales bacterium PH28_bin88]|nr:hypothetical protein SY88_22705 [Clostridiales bacterium PH28_bin88]
MNSPPSKLLKNRRCKNNPWPQRNQGLFLLHYLSHPAPRQVQARVHQVNDKYLGFEIFRRNLDVEPGVLLGGKEIGIYHPVRPLRHRGVFKRRSIQVVKVVNYPFLAGSKLLGLIIDLLPGLAAHDDNVSGGEKLPPAVPFKVKHQPLVVFHQIISDVVRIGDVSVINYRQDNLLGRVKRGNKNTKAQDNQKSVFQKMNGLHRLPPYLELNKMKSFDKFVGISHTFQFTTTPKRSQVTIIAFRTCFERFYSNNRVTSPCAVQERRLSSPSATFRKSPFLSARGCRPFGGLRPEHPARVGGLTPL